jgi:ATP-dependent DNA helicase RecG
MTDQELADLLHDLESDRVERKASDSAQDKIRQAICAFANDLQNYNQPGVIFVGVKDDGSCAKLQVTQELLDKLAQWRSDGKILPLPSMGVRKVSLNGCEMAVIIVQPATAPPVRYEGRIWVRVGATRAIASAQEEQRLNEKRKFRDLPFDLRPFPTANLSDLSRDYFLNAYLPNAVAPDVLAQNERTLEEKLTSVRFATPDDPPIPTALGLLTVGLEPTAFIPGGYVQFLRIDGLGLADPITDQKEIAGPLPDLLRLLDETLKVNIKTATDIASQTLERRTPDYPIAALQQLSRNAVMHRSYENTNAPVRIYWFSDRIEISNPGGPFGQVTRKNFGNPSVADYRNPYLAAVMKDLGYAQKFGSGISIARKELAANGNPPPEFQPEDSHLLVTVRRGA